MDLKNRIEEAYSEGLQIYHHLHQNPDLSEQEKSTADFICSRLDALGISYQRNIAGHGVCAVIEGTKPGAAGGAEVADADAAAHAYRSAPPCIGIRADIDALPICENSGLPFASEKPGIMHACGHDLHTAILLGTAQVLQKIRGEFSGYIKLFFQPSEETIGGADAMIKAGVMQNPDVNSVIGIHMDPAYETGSIALRSGPMNAAVDDFTMKVIGRQCHGAHPEAGIDPIVTAADIIMSLQTIVSRTVAATTPAVITVGQIQGGSSCNTIPEEVTLVGTVRSLTNEGLADLKEKLTKTARATASKYGASVETLWMSTPFPPLYNDGAVCRIIENTAAVCDSLHTVHHMAEPSMGADDFAFFTEAVPGAYFNLGCTKAGESWHPLHSDKFAADEEVIRCGIEVEVKTALALL